MQLFQRSVSLGEALDECIAPENDLVAERPRHTGFAHPLGHEGGIVRLSCLAVRAELTEPPVGVDPGLCHC